MPRGGSPFDMGPRRPGNARRNPDEELRKIERTYQQDPTMENFDKLQALARDRGLLDN